MVKETIKYAPFGVTVTRRQLADIAAAIGKAKSPQTIANWLKYYGEANADIEVMLKTKFGINNAYELQKKIEAPNADAEFKARNDAALNAMGFPPFNGEERTDAKEEALSEGEKQILEAMGYRMDEHTEEDAVPEQDQQEDMTICEEPVENVPDREDLMLVNDVIRKLAKVRTIPGFGMDAISEAEETMKAARGVFFGHLIDWDALASGKGA